MTTATLEKFSKYGLTGVLSLGLETLTYGILTMTPLWYVAAGAVSATVGFLFGLVVNRRWTFGSRGNLAVQAALLGVLFVVNLVAGGVLLWAITEGLGVPNLVSKLLTMGVIALWNFPLYQKVIFR